jgi:hypothetical protein
MISQYILSICGLFNDAVTSSRSQINSVGISAGYGLEDWGSIPGGCKIFLSFIESRPVLGPTQLPSQSVLGSLSPGIKRQRRVADHWPPYSAQVKSGGTIPPLSKVWGFTAVTMKNTVFWDVASCRSCVRSFGGKYFLHLQGRKIRVRGTSLSSLQSVTTCSRWFLARGFFCSEDWGDTFLRNVGSHKIYTVPHPRRRHSSYSSTSSYVFIA